MKKSLFVLSLVSLGFLFLNFSTINSQEGEKKENLKTIQFPDNVQAILDQSCYGCHNSESKSMMGRKKLSFDKLNGLKTHKAIGKLSAIAESVLDGDMPKKKAIKKNPSLALTDAQAEILVKWAEGEADKLAGE
ncbi:MAG: heme-binding domain-containing protein [Bacteroidales bacterium]|nr:heme-binding domain-containing protein [Bacteroidales bacterium]